MQTLLVFPTAAERQETSGSTCDGVDSGVRAGRRIERGPINLLLVSDGCFVSPTPMRGYRVLSYFDCAELQGRIGR